MLEHAEKTFHRQNGCVAINSNRNAGREPVLLLASRFHQTETQKNLNTILDYAIVRQFSVSQNKI